MVIHILCLNCGKKIPRLEAYVDRIGQFPKLNAKAMEMGKSDVEICYDCFEELTQHSKHQPGTIFGQS